MKIKKNLMISNLKLPEKKIIQPINCSDLPQIRSLVKLAYDQLGKGIVIWILDPPTKRLSGCSYIDKESVYFDSQSVNFDENSEVVSILESNDISHFKLSSDINLSLFSKVLKPDKWKLVHCIPLSVGGKTIGAIFYPETQTQKEISKEIDNLRNISGIATVIFENEFRRREIISLSNMAHLMRSSMDFNQAMQYLVDAAKENTGAESSTLFQFNYRTRGFEVGYRSPYVKTQPKSKPRSKGGLTWHILQTGQSIKINDVNKESNIRDSVKERGVQSIVGVRIQLEEEKIGVIYINGKRKNQFSEYDVKFLQTLADYASLALGGSKAFLKSTEEIESALDKIFDIESNFNLMCEEIEKSIKTDYISIQLIDKKEQIIESVFGTGLSVNWTGLSKHYIEKTDYLRDLQADIVQSQHTEILNGNDERLDQYIYEKLQNKNVARITTPIILFRDESDLIIEQDHGQCEWKILADLRKTELIENSIINENITQFTVLGLCDTGNKKNCKISKEVIGTIGAGYQDATKIIDPKIAIELNKIIAKWAPVIYSNSLQSVLEVIVRCAMKSVRADSATLHFMHNPEDNSYVYEVSAGAVTRQFLRKHPPRDGGIGWEAIDEEVPKFIPDLAFGQKLNHLKNENRQIYNEGIRAIAAFPLIIGNNKGVLYIHFHRQHRFTEDEITLVKIFSKRAADAIRHATAYTAMQNSARHLSVLNSVAYSLARTPRGKKLLSDIAWITLNLFAADVVTIYEYTETEDRFIVPPEIAGRLRYEPAMDTEIKKGDVPYNILDEKGNVWAHDSIRDPRLKRSIQKRKDGRESFVKREKIKSSAGVKLKVGKEIVGLMFINYRRKHLFDDEQIKVFLTLASSAAIAIKNRRMLELFSEIDKEILTTLNLGTLLNLIVQTAVKISMADVCELRLIDYHKIGLSLKAKYPIANNNSNIIDIMDIKIGVCGHVATTGEPLLIKDVSKSPQYVICDPKTKSELCVPIIDKNLDVIGVLNMESYQKNTFDTTHKRMLESLANRAVIAIQNSENQNRMVADKAMAEIGIVTTLITHKMNSIITGIKETANIIRKLKQKDIDLIRTMANTIFNESNTIVNDIQHHFNDIEHFEEYIDNSFSKIDIRKDLLEALRIIPNEKYIANTEIDQNVVFLNISKKQFVELISTIIQNSIDAMPNGGNLSVGSRKHSILHHRFIHIWIEDNGCGISKIDLKKIFEPKFSRKKCGKGLGFGLWTVKKIIDRLGGKITVDSNQGHWTKFFISIPYNENLII